MHKPSLPTVVASVAALLTAGSVVSLPANVSTPAAAETDLAYVRQALQRYELSSEVRLRLLADFVAGRVWDSQSGAEPVATDVERIDTVERTIYRYPDGSINVSEMSVPGATEPTDVDAARISDCVLIQQRYDVWIWDNCQVSWDAITWSMHYTAKYGIYQFGSDIYHVGNLSWGGVGSFSDPALEIVTEHAHGRSNPAVAQGKVTQHGGPVMSRTVGVRLKVRADWGGGRSSSFGD